MSEINPLDLINPLGRRGEIGRTIATWIRDGTLPAGARLQTAKRLAEIFDTTPAVVGRALGDLSDRGLIDRAGYSYGAWYVRAGYRDAVIDRDAIDWTRGGATIDADGQDTTPAPE